LRTILARAETITRQELERTRLSRLPASRRLHSPLADDFHNAWLDNITSIDDSLLPELLVVLIAGTGDSRLRLSDGFDDGAELLAAAERMGLEGVVSKRRDAPYRSGTRCGWVKTKTKAWREANKDRWRLFERQ
jgi:hypothetical protein